MCNCWGRKNVAVPAQRTAPITVNRQTISNIENARTIAKNVLNKKDHAAQEYQNRLKNINGMPKSVLPTT